MKIKNFDLKQGGKKFIGGLVAASMTMANGGVVAEAASKKQTTLEPYSSKKTYDIDRPMVLNMPVSIKVNRDGSMNFNYVTVTTEYDRDTINPTEVVDMINGARQLNKNTGATEFVYLDANEVSFKKFKTNNARKNSDKKTLLKYISKRDKRDQKEINSIRSEEKYAEFMLPVYANYSFKSNTKPAEYEKVEYVTYFVPFEKLSEKTDFVKLAEKVYARYQDGSFDHVVTWNEIQKVKTK